MTSQSSGRHRIKSLDALRGVAILLVLGTHKYVNRYWLMAGWSGVDLFFVLSGFLVAGLLFSEYKMYGTISLKRFLIRRGLKIYPGYYLLLAYLVVRNLIEGRGMPTRLLMSFVFLQNYDPKAIDYTWSLCVEEHFYLILSIGLTALVAWSNRRGRGLAGAAPGSPAGLSSLPVLIAFGCGLALSLRCLTALFLDYHSRTHNFQTHLRLDSLMAGVLISYFFHFHHELLRSFVRRRRAWLAVLAVALLAPCLLILRADKRMFTLGLSGIYVGYGCLVLLALFGGRDETAPLASPRSLPGLVAAGVTGVLAYLGYHSYAIYLWHSPVLTSGLLPLVERFAPVHLSNGASFAIYAFCSIALGIVMTKAVEAPMLRVRDRLWPTRGSVRFAAPEPAPALPQAVSVTK